MKACIFLCLLVTYEIRNLYFCDFNVLYYKKIHSTIVYEISKSFIRMNYFKCFVNWFNHVPDIYAKTI